MKNLPWMAALLLLAGGAGRADVIYFKSGAVREVREVLYERGGMLYYTTLEGENIVGIPASVVLKWERSVVEIPEKPSPDDAPASEPSMASAEESGPSVAAPPAMARRVFTPEDLPPLEAARLANPFDAVVRRMLARAHGQFAVEADVHARFLVQADAPSREPARAAHMARARALAPDDTLLAAVEAIHGLLDEERHDEAERMLRMERDPAASPDYMLLLLEGLLAYERGDLADAVEAWSAASRMNPSFQALDDYVAHMRREIAAREGLAGGASRHFLFEFDHAVDAATTSEIVEMLEDAYARITNALNHYPRRPLAVLVYAKADFEAVTGLPADYVEGLFDGKIRLPLRALLRHRDALRATLAHETAHAIIHAKTRGNASRWIHEGLAQRLEEHRDAGRYAASYLRAFESAGERAPLPFDYPSAHLWVEYLAEAYGFHRIVEFLETLAANPDENAAYARAFGFTRDELAARWPEFLRGMAAARSPFEDANPFTR